MKQQGKGRALSRPLTYGAQNLVTDTFVQRITTTKTPFSYPSGKSSLFDRPNKTTKPNFISFKTGGDKNLAIPWF